MGVYFNSMLALHQMMLGGALYSPDWYITLAKGSSNPYTTGRSSWQIPGTATPLTTGWSDDPLTTTQTYVAAISNSSTVDVVIPAADTITYWVISQGTGDTWQFIGRFNNYPLSVSAGDTVRFLPGALRIAIST